MPQKTWVVGEEALAADFNNYVQNQVVATFPTIAARDAWAGPPNGALCITTDTNSQWQRVAGAWRPPPGSVVFAQSVVTAVDLSMPTTGTFDIPPTLTPPVLQYPTMLVVTASIGLGNSNAGVASYQPSLQRIGDGVILTHAGAVPVTSGLWAWRTMVWAYAVAPNSGGGAVKSRVTIVGLGGAGPCFGSTNMSAIQYAT